MLRELETNKTNKLLPGKASLKLSSRIRGQGCPRSLQDALLDFRLNDTLVDGSFVQYNEFLLAVDFGEDATAFREHREHLVFGDVGDVSWRLRERGGGGD